MALGENALLRRGQEDTLENLNASARGAAETIADIVAAEARELLEAGEFGAGFRGPEGRSGDAVRRAGVAER